MKAEQTLDELQNQLKKRGLKENNLNVSLRSAQNAHERLNSAKMLLREKMLSYEVVERVVRLFEESKINEKRAQEELSSATEQYKQAQKAYLEAQEKQATKEAAYASLVSERNIVRKQIDTLTAEQRGFVHRKETIEAAQKALSENLSATRAKAQVLEAQLVDAKARLHSSQREEVEQAKHEKALSEEYEHTQQLAVEARDKLNASLQVREEARRKLDEARDELTKVSAERSALEELERASAELNPVRQWLDDKDHGFDTAFVPLVQAVTVPRELESLVEALLGDALQTLIFSDDERMIEAIRAGVLADDCSGGARFVHTSLPEQKNLLPHEHWLFEELTVKDSFENAVGALLGDVYIARNLTEALELHDRQTREQVRFVSLDGCVVGYEGVSLCFLLQRRRAKKVLFREGVPMRSFAKKR